MLLSVKYHSRLDDACVCTSPSHSEEKGRGKGAFAKVRSEKVKSEMCHGEKTKNTTERV